MKKIQFLPFQALLNTPDVIKNDQAYQFLCGVNYKDMQKRSTDADAREFDLCPISNFMSFINFSGFLTIYQCWC
jgi:hypothetical protein